MTNQELYNIVGHRPFIGLNTATSDVHYLMFLNPHEYVSMPPPGVESMAYYILETHLAGWPRITLVDWFDSDDTSSSACTCDMYNVLLIRGCQCGGT